MRTGDFSVGDFALFAYYLTFLGEFSAEFGGLLLQYRQAQVFVAQDRQVEWCRAT